MSERRHVRPIERSGFKKSFKPLVVVQKRVPNKLASALEVVIDLQRGSLASLYRYLAQRNGIPDRAVAIELRKLISGTKCRTRYRLLVIEHPDLPKSKGGAPKRRSPTPKQKSIVEHFELILEKEGKVWRAMEVMEEEHGVKKDVIDRARRRVKTAAQKERKERVAASRPTLQARHERALEHLRQERQGGISD